MRKEKNVFLRLEYRGGNYYGFARQRDVLSVEEVLSRAISQIAASPVKIIVAGRTDRGVHAAGQVISFSADLPNISQSKFTRALNGLLPEDIRILETKFFTRPKDARRQAVLRRYIYNVLNGEECVFLSPYVFYLKPALNLTAMKKAASFLVGKKDFRPFGSTGSNFKTTVRRILKIEIKVKNVWDFFWFFGKNFKNSKIYQFIIEADAFLYKMCRHIVAALLEVGLGRLSSEDIKKMFLLPKGFYKIKPVPAKGLFLAGVNYSKR